MNGSLLLGRITSRPGVFGGKPPIRDLRISVESILGLLAQGESEAFLLEDYPELGPEDFRACLGYAHAVISRDALASVRLAGFDVSP